MALAVAMLLGAAARAGEPSCGCQNECTCGAEQTCGCDNGCDNGCDACCDSCCDDCCGGLGGILTCNRCGDEEPWKLFDSCCLDCNNITIGGWVQGGYSYNNRKPVNPGAGLGNYPHAVNYRHDQFQLNQLYGYVEKTTVTDCCDEWDWGGRVDILYGEDYIWNQAVGLELRDNGAAHWNHGPGSGHNGLFGTSRNGLAMPQAYFTLAYADWTAKFGHFYTMLGYESTMATNNFFYSHQWAVRFGEPTTHTGVWLTKQVNEQLSAHVCVVNGWDKFDAESDRASVMVGVNWKSCDEATTLAAALITGDEDGTTGAFTGNRTGYTIVFTQQLGDDWQYVLQHDNYWWDNAAPGGTQAEWYGLTNYLFYTINPCWKAGVRYEWFNDQHGTRIDNAFGGNFGAHWHELSLGLNWTPHPNVLVRPEVRWDWVDYHAGAGPVPQASPIFDGFTKASQTVFGIDAIFKF